MPRVVDRCAVQEVKILIGRRSAYDEAAVPAVDRTVAFQTEREFLLRALRANRDAGQAGVRAARLTYLPSLAMSAGWSGFARQISDEGSLIDNYRAGVDAQRQNCVLINELYSRLTPPLPPEDCNQFSYDPAAEADILERNDAYPFGYEDQPFEVFATLGKAGSIATAGSFCLFCEKMRSSLPTVTSVSPPCVAPAGST